MAQMTFKDAYDQTRPIINKDPFGLIKADIATYVKHYNILCENKEEFESLCKRIMSRWIRFDCAIDLEDFVCEIADLIGIGDYEDANDDCLREAWENAGNHAIERIRHSQEHNGF